MNLAPLLSASPVIQIHVAAAVLALVVGGLVLFRRKGDRRHRALGKLWVGLMALVAISSFFIWTIRMFGLFSPIHLLSLLTLVALWQGVGYARRHDIARHRLTMQLTYIGALVVTGLFTFAPGRLMNRVVFGPSGADPLASPGFLVFAAAALAFAGLVLWRNLAGTRRASRASANP
jgi:uncharacterized membrane protein